MVQQLGPIKMVTKKVIIRKLKIRSCQIKLLSHLKFQSNLKITFSLISLTTKIQKIKTFTNKSYPKI